MKRFLWLLAILGSLLLAGCGAPAASKYAAFNGSWQSDLLTFSIDLDKKTYSNAIGGLTNAPIEILAEQDNAVTFNLTDSSLGTKPWTLRTQEDGSLRVEEDGKPLPVILKRSP